MVTTDKLFYLLKCQLMKLFKKYYDVDFSEKVVRYIYHHKQYGKYSTFMAGDNKVSVNRIIGLTEEVIWDIGKMIGLKRKCNLHGRAELLVSEITKIKVDIYNLRVVQMPILSNLLHAEIINLSLDRAIQKLNALALHKISTFRLFSN